MKLYSIQTVEAYNQLLENNILYCLDNKYIWSEFEKPSFRKNPSIFK